MGAAPDRMKQLSGGTYRPLRYRGPDGIGSAVRCQSVHRAGGRM